MATLPRLAEQRAIYDVPPVQGFTDTFQLGPGLTIRGFIVENFSKYAVTILYGRTAPSSNRVFDHRTGAYFKESETCDTQILGLRVDTLPDGTVAPDQGNPYIKLTLDTEPIGPTSVVLVQPTTSTVAANVTVTQLPTPAALGDGTANPSTTLLEALLGGLDAAGNWDRLRAAGETDGVTPVALGALHVLAPQLAYNGASFDRLRTPQAVKSVQASAAGSTALWTPAAGNKVRLMRYRVSLTQNATLAAAGLLTVKLLDGATDLNLWETFYVPATGTTSHHAGAWIDLGNGVVLAAAGDVLNVSLSAALATGVVTVTAAGVEAVAP
jgi:hypothetical protein